MTMARLCPLADTSSQWFDSRWSGGGINPNVAVLHSTETPSWPGYNGGGNAPHLTYLWKPNKTLKQKLRQHFGLDRSARALVDAAGGVSTNRNNTMQIELVGTCDKNYYARWKSRYPDLIYWGDPPEEAMQDLITFFRWYDKTFPNFNPDQRVPRGWLRYPDSYGNKHRQRMTYREWDSFYGICGHQHVPENDHGDPGDFPIEQLIRGIKGTASPTTPSKKGKLIMDAADEKKIREIITEVVRKESLRGDVVPRPTYSKPDPKNPADVKNTTWRGDNVMSYLIDMVHDLRMTNKASAVAAMQEVLWSPVVAPKTDADKESIPADVQGSWRHNVWTIQTKLAVQEELIRKVAAQILTAEQIEEATAVGTNRVFNERIASVTADVEFRVNDTSTEAEVKDIPEPVGEDNTTGPTAG